MHFTEKQMTLLQTLISIENITINNNLENLNQSEEVTKDCFKNILNYIHLLDEHQQVSGLACIATTVGLLAAGLTVAGLGIIGLPLSVLSILLGCIVMVLNIRINKLMEKQTGIPIVQKSVIKSWVRFEQYIEVFSEPSQKIEEIGKEIKKLKNHSLDVKAFSIIRLTINSNKGGNLKKNCIEKIDRLISIKEKDKSVKIQIFKRNHTTLTADDLKQIKLNIEKNPIFNKIFNAKDKNTAREELKKTLEAYLKKKYSTTDSY